MCAPVGQLLLLDTRCRRRATDPDPHLGLHLVHILLSVLNHLDSLVPLLLEGRLCSLDLLLLHLDPPIDLLLLRLVGTRRDLVLVQLLLDDFLLPALSKLEHFLAELDEFGVLVVLHDDAELLLGELLECVPIKHRGARLACYIEVVHVQGRIQGGL